jgi:hypothetical protein
MIRISLSVAAAILVLCTAQLTVVPVAESRGGEVRNFYRARQAATSYEQARAICRAEVSPSSRVMRYRKSTGVVDCSRP